MEDTVTISRDECERLQEDSAFLDALRAAGVDNWMGYDDDCAIARGEDPY